MNCDEYKAFFQQNAKQMPGLLPPHRHPACRDIAKVNNNPNMERQMTPDMLEEPSLLELARNFTAALTKWVKAGAPVVSEEVYRERYAICEACEYWKPEARLGLGKCGARGCGCTKLKLWLSTEHCPIGKWPGDYPAPHSKTGPA